MTDVSTNGNCIAVGGAFEASDFRRVLAAMHNTVSKKGYGDVRLDFSRCKAAFAGPMLALCSQVVRLRRDGIDAELIPPSEYHLASLFRNANWANLIDPNRQRVSGFRGYTHVPATQFTSASDQTSAVNCIMDALMTALTDFSRQDLRAIEWSVNEITDNVLNHSESIAGGIVQVTTFRKRTKRVEYAVCDSGIGVPASLAKGHPTISSHPEALDLAIREGVTRDKSRNQGNGLFGSFRICELSGGYFDIHSGYARLSYNSSEGLHISSESVPFNGTLVVASIDYSRPHVLDEALKFGGKLHTPVDFIEQKYEEDSGVGCIFPMRNEVRSFGTRAGAVPVRAKLLNLIALCPGKRITLDFNDVPLVSSSFADEVFGKMFVQLGAIEFTRAFEFIHVSATVKHLVDRAIAQRAAAGL